MHRNSTGKMRNKKKAMSALLIVLGIALVCFIGVIAAKYFYNTSYSGNQIGAKDFYFTIDSFLEDTGDENETIAKTVHLYGAAQRSYTFNVINYYDALRINTEDITFTASCQASDGISATLTANDEDANNGSFQLKGGDRSSQALKVTFGDGATDGDWVKVTVKSSAPYVKEMELLIYYNPQDYKVLYRVEDEPGKTYARLVVMAGEEVSAGALDIDWSGVNSSGNLLQIDTTDTDILYQVDELTGDFMTSATNNNRIVAGGSLAIYFFKADPSQDYSISDYEPPVSNGKYQVYIPKIN